MPGCGIRDKKRRFEDFFSTRWNGEPKGIKTVKKMRNAPEENHPG